MVNPMIEPEQPFNIMAKPVSGLCNLKCKYCYYLDKPAELYPNVHRPMMTDPVLESYTRQYIATQPVQCTFCWQGGEPLLAGKDFFRQAIMLQNQYRLKGQLVENAIQTNGTLLDDEWCEFFAANKFLVGISLDGPPQWHDRFRKDPAGKPTYHRAWAGLELMQKHGVEFNVLVTLNSANAPHAGDIYRYFTNRGIRFLQFIPILERDADGNPTEFSCRPEQFGKFLWDVFEIWASRDINRVSERFIDSILHTFIHGQATMCCHSKKCANAFVLEFNGDLYACDHFVYEGWLLGNIMETPLEELACCDKLQEFAKLKTDLPKICMNCEYLYLCNAGCPKHHIPLYGNADRVNFYCQGYKQFLSSALPELQRIAKCIKRNETPSPKQASSKPSQSQNRNAPCPCGSGKKFKHCCGGKK